MRRQADRARDKAQQNPDRQTSCRVHRAVSYTDCLLRKQRVRRAAALGTGSIIQDFKDITAISS
jgi:hypothetical protein